MNYAPINNNILLNKFGNYNVINVSYDDISNNNKKSLKLYKSKNIEELPLNNINVSNNKKYNKNTKIIEGTHIKNKLADLYFSSKNIKKIQKMIKKEIYIRTKGFFKLDVDQDKKDILVSMRSIYINYAKFIPYDYKKQIKILNKHLINYIIPDMITQIKQGYGYLLDLNKPLDPIMRPLNTSNAGRNTLPALSTLIYK
jgi:hypothetical protein